MNTSLVNELLTSSSRILSSACSNLPGNPSSELFASVTEAIQLCQNLHLVSFWNIYLLLNFMYLTAGCAGPLLLAQAVLQLWRAGAPVRRGPGVPIAAAALAAEHRL